MLNAHPQVAYRFEPFHRGKKSKTLQSLLSRLRESEFGPEETAALYRELLIANAQTEKPPFFHKTNTRNRGRNLLWPVARSVPPANGLFQWLYTPRGHPPLIFKEVTQTATMRALLEKTAIPIAFLVRSPFGTVDSLLRGQASGKMPTGRFTVLGNLVRAHDPALYDRYEGHFDDLSDAQKNALLWRIDVEAAVQAMHAVGRGVTVTFERMCDDAHTEMQKICAEFGLKYHDAIRAFIDKLYALDGNASTDHFVGDRYFSVFRNPHRQREQWRNTLPDAAYEEVLAVVDDSPAFRRLAEQGGWLHVTPGTTAKA